MAKSKWTVEWFKDLSACWMEIGDYEAAASVEEYDGGGRRYRAFFLGHAYGDPEDMNPDEDVDVLLGDDFETAAEAQLVAHEALCSWLADTGQIAKARRLDPALPAGVLV